MMYKVSSQHFKMAVAQDDADMERIAEDELAKLQRQFRIMEMERSAWRGGVGRTLRTQRNTLQILNRELEAVTLQLELIKSPSNMAASASVRDKLTGQLAEYDRLSDLVRAERDHIREVDFLLRQVEKEIKSIQAKGARAEESFSKTTTNYAVISQLEDRLDHALKRFNSVNTQNYQMRQEIDKLLLDRQAFNAVWKNHVRQLSEGKAQILELVEQNIMTYEQREEWCNKLQQLLNKSAADYAKHCSEIRDLKRQLDHSLKLEDFLRTKGTVRLTAADAKAEAKRLEQLEQQQQIYNNYVNILHSIKEFTGESDVDKIVQEFNRREEENYALFNYVNEVNAELRLIHESVRNLRSNLAQERSQHEARAAQQQESLDSLQQTLREQQDSNSKLKSELDKSTETLNALLGSIRALAESSQCDSLPLVKLLGKNADINTSNVKMYLKCIEKKIIEISDVIRADEILRRQAEAKERTPPSTRRKSNLPRTPRRSPRDRPAVSPVIKPQDKILLAAP